MRTRFYDRTVLIDPFVVAKMRETARVKAAARVQPKSPAPRLNCVPEYDKIVTERLFYWISGVPPEAVHAIFAMTDVMVK